MGCRATTSSPWTEAAPGESWRLSSSGKSWLPHHSMTLRDVMAVTTILQQELAYPEFFIPVEPTEEASMLSRIRERLDAMAEEKVLHPGDLFRMIAGTSTGALMSFGLLHGEKIYTTTSL